MKNARRNIDTDTSKSWLYRVAPQPLGVCPITRLLKDTLRGTLLPLHPNLVSTSLSSTRSRSMKTTQNIKSAYVGTGIRPPGKEKTLGTKELSTFSSLPAPKKPLSLTGKRGKSTRIMTNKRVFTLSQSSQPILLCDQCGRSTFTLTLVRIGKRHFIEMRCTCCGTSGNLECKDWSGIISSSPTHRTVAELAVSAGHKEGHVNSKKEWI
jgi:hypothetical protein